MRTGRYLTPVSLTVGAVCTILYLIASVMGQAGTSAGMIMFGAYYKPFILAGEYWRLLSVGIVHASIWHLMMNMMSLYALGTALERSLGGRRYFLILFGSVLGSSLFLFAAQGNVLAVGLSGGLYGLMAAYFILVARAGGLAMPKVRTAMLSTLAINLLINFMPGVSWMAHLGGAVTGALLTGILCPDLRDASRQKHYTITAVILAVSLAGLSWRNAYIPENQTYILTDYQVLTAEKQYLPSSYISHMAEKLDAIYGSGTMLEDAVAQQEA